MEIRFVEQDDRALAQLSQELDSFFFDLLGAVYLEYQPHNTLSGLAGAVVAYEAGEAVGCACWKPFDAVTAELKRVYVRPEQRRSGTARRMVAQIEQHAAASGCHRMVIETAKELDGAAALYLGQGYRPLPEGFGPYIGDSGSLCFEKEISDGTMR